MKRLFVAMLGLLASGSAVSNFAVFAEDATAIRALIVDGQNNHDWRKTTPLIKATLEGAGLFKVDVATTPEKGDMSSFRPKFSEYAVVVSNYNGQAWSKDAANDFEAFVKNGGGFVSVHAADNSFPEWPEYNKMIGLGGWGGRSEKSGPYVRWKDGQFTKDTTPGGGGSHGKKHPFAVIVRDAQHPITKGLPSSWMAAEDELYAQLRGPAENMQVLATAFSDKSTGGTGEHEPILMAIEYGKGRVFHSTLGHDVKAMQGVAFQTTLQRGTEWAATGKVTLPAVSESELTSDKPALRDPTTLSAKTSSPSVNFDTVPNPDSGSWVSLFNGKDLTGWSQKNGTAKYSVKDETVLGTTEEGSPNSFMCSEKEYADFELTFEVKVDDQLNSGVQIRSRSLAEMNNGRVHGPQVEIEASPGEAGYIYGEGTPRGWISKQQPQTKAIKNGEWNRYLVRAVGPRIQTWINGQKIEDLVDENEFKKGFIGLQVHGIAKGSGPFSVQWRDIRINEIK